MTRQLRLYSGINPNAENGIHYFFNTASQFINELQSHLIATIPLDNYRINLNVAKVALKDGITMANFEKVTYIIDYDETTLYFKCYFVESILLQDYAVYTLRVDLWATYIINATFKNIHVSRCNRAIDAHGIYDDVLATYERREENANFIYDTGEAEGYIRDNKVWIVYLVEYNVEQSALWGDQHISATRLFASRLSDLRGNVVNKSPVEIAIDAIGGIHKIQNGMDARVIQAWLLPQWLVNCGSITGDYKPTSRYAVFQSRGQEGNYTFNGYIVFPSTKVMDLIGNDFDLNYATYIGTRNNGFKPKRFVNKYFNELGLYCFMGTNSLKVVMIQGNEQKDFTNDFEVTLTTNNGEVTGLRAVASVIGKTAINTASFMGSYFKSDYAGMAKQLTNTIGTAIQEKPTIDHAVGSGDGANFYWRAIMEDTEAEARKLYFPIIKEVFYSTRDEEMHARMQGANFDKYISGFDFPLTKALLGTGNHLTFEDTYIVADCIIEGVPNDALNEIKNKLATGIYYKYLSN